MPSPARPHLVARQLACRRGNRRLFAGVDLTLARGTVTWLRGANGCGKTSLMRILAGLSPPESGRVERDGALLYIAHANALKDDLTLAESVAFLAQLHGLPQPRERAARALDVLGISGRARALALDDAPCAWILDEPFDALDADGAERLATLIGSHAARGGSVLLTSHQPVAVAGMLEYDLQASPTP